MFPVSVLQPYLMVLDSCYCYVDDNFEYLIFKAGYFTGALVHWKSFKVITDFSTFRKTDLQFILANTTTV